MAKPFDELRGKMSPQRREFIETRAQNQNEWDKIAIKFHRIPLRYLNLSKRTFGLLERNGYRYIGDILKADQDIRHIPYLGTQGLEEISKKVEEFLAAWGDTNPAMPQAIASVPGVLAELPVDILNLSGKASSALKSFNKSTIGDLLDHSEGDLTQLHGIGVAIAKEIDSQIQELFAMIDSQNLDKWPRYWVISGLPKTFDASLSTQQIIQTLPQILKEVIECYYPDERVWQVIELRYRHFAGFPKLSRQEIGERLNMSHQWAYELEKRALNFLQRNIFFSLLRPRVAEAIQAFREDNQITNSVELLEAAFKLSSTVLQIPLPGIRKSISLPEFQEKQRRLNQVGELGELIVLEHEKKSLTQIYRIDLAKQVQQISHKDVTAGYDIISFDHKGNPKYIEVKATESTTMDFFISANELAMARKYRSFYWLYRVVKANSESPEIKMFQDPFQMIEQGLWQTEPTSYSVSIAVVNPNDYEE